MTQKHHSATAPKNFLASEYMKECINYKKIDNKNVQCFACSHFCKIRNGRTGVCGVRQNLDRKLYLLVYGKSIAANIDPIEKKPLFHFYPGSKAFSFGTLGCNFRCANCQNYDISQMYNLKGKIEEYDKINFGFDLSPQQIIEITIANNCKSIAYTYNEPTVFLEYALDTMKLAKKKGIYNVWVSNGYMSNKTLDLIIPFLDAINIDIKSFDSHKEGNKNFYRDFCGGELSLILDNCKRLAKEKIWIEITTLIIPTISDNEKMIENLAKFIKNELGDFVPWHISAFSPQVSWKLKKLENTPLNKLKKTYRIGIDAGLRHVYAGNIFDESMENTYCAKCGVEIITRRGYNIKRNDIDGRCLCGENIAGIFL